MKQKLFLSLTALASVTIVSGMQCRVSKNHCHKGTAPTKVSPVPTRSFSVPAPKVSVHDAIKKVSSVAALDEVIKSSNKLVIIDFWATWCGPCRMIAPFYEKMAAKYGDKLTFVKAEYDKVATRGQSYQVRGLPGFVIVNKTGKKIDSFSGNNPKGLEAFINKHIK